MKKILPIIIALIIIGAGAFYGGMKYAQSTRQNFAKQNFGELDQNFQNLSPEQRQELLQGNVGGTFQRGAGRGTGSNFVSGEVIAKDEQSLTLKMPEGGSKIIFYSGNTEVGKFVNGTPDDLEIGKSVTINGTTNQDGSITAQSIQLRPEINPSQ